jgi:hypothetical protein
MVSLPIDVAPQPDTTTCGPTCLQAVYRFLGDEIPLSQVISEVTPLPGGGTLAVSLACHALRRGYGATIYTYNLRLFDPSWFAVATPAHLAERLDLQRRAKGDDPKLGLATDAYREFLDLGGDVRYEDLTPTLVTGCLRQGTPVLAGLSATYLYRCAREFEDDYDDVRGDPAGHFVVVSGFDADQGQVVIADPLRDNPRFDTPSYRVSIARFVGAVLLGIVTYDANLLAIAPRAGVRGSR